MERTRILVWDLPLRVFHWLLVASFAGAFLTAESRPYRDFHVVLGYLFMALLAFRLAWAFVGTRHARLASFAFGPAAVVGYLKSLLRGNPMHYAGHNPAGSWMIYALVLLGFAAGASGYAVHVDLAGHWLEELHEGLANALLALVVAHVAGVVVSSLAHRENLPLAMVTGYKRGESHEAIPRSRWMTAAALLLAVGILGSAVLQSESLTKVQGDSMKHRHKHSHEHRDARERGS